MSAAIKIVGIQNMPDIAFDLGASAYSEGIFLNENPYSKELEPELHKLWADGWKHEREYWEFGDDE